MSRLTDIVSEVISETKDAEGSINTSQAVTLGVPMVRKDDKAVDQCISEALAIRIKAVATRERKKSNTGSRDQLSFFDLRPRHALDIEGRILKSTHALTRLEFERIRQIRRESLSADAAYLQKLDNAAIAVAPFWDAHPEATFGEVCDLLRKAA